MSGKATRNDASVGRVETHIARPALPDGGFRLSSGASLPVLEVAYETYGTLSPERDNAVFICPTLTSDAHAAGYHTAPDADPGWWDQMVGPGKGVDTNLYFVVCANILGGCKGTTGPSSTDPRTGRPFGSSFPAIALDDMVNAHVLLVRHLGIDKLAAVIGGSLGGMQALNWTIRYPAMVSRCVCIAAASSLSAQALAFDIVGRNAITADPNWQEGDYYGTGRSPEQGLALARKIGHITYLSPEMMDAKFGRERHGKAGSAGGFESDFQVGRYLEYQGEKFIGRFDANSYLHITRAMDEFDLVEGHASLEAAFSSVRAKMLIVALSSDWLFPPEQSRELANALLSAGKPVSYCLLRAPHGHDAFLVDIENLADVIRAFLPWVRAGSVPAPEELRLSQTAREEYAAIRDMVRPGSKVLDLGCGDGALLTMLAREKGVRGIGVDIDIANVMTVIDRGHDVFQGDIDAGLATIPDNSYDYAILSETLQEVRRPRLVLGELLRVAAEGIVTFPNFAKLCHRVKLAVGGRMPQGGAIPFTWYDTPNIHLFTLRDFVALCREEGIEVRELACFSGDGMGRFLTSIGLPNAGADRVLARIARPGRKGRT
jgi:homoserine O-acetyltransferase